MFIFEEERGRQRKKIGDIEKRALFDWQKGRCMYCGIKRNLNEFDIDHKNPHSRGGSDSLRNLQLLCRTCNTRKGAKTDGEFRKVFSAILEPARQAKGPPSRAIPQSKFEAIQKTVSANKAKRRTRNDDWNWGW